MRRLILVVVVVLAILQGYVAVQWTRFSLAFTSSRRYRDAGEYAAALDLMERAVHVRPESGRARAYVGDFAMRLFARPKTRRSPEEEKAILDRAWAGYAGAVTVAPLDSWSWSGLAEVAAREAQREDRVNGVSLEVLDARSRGVLDPWRAIALGAAQLALVISPSGYEELDTLGLVYETAGEVELAADTYVRSARLMSAPSFHDWGTGRTFAAPIYDRLLKALIAGIAAAPTYDRSLLHLEVARFAREQGDLETAIAQARLAERMASGSFERYRATSELAVALARDDPRGAREAWRRAEETGFDPDVVALNLATLESRLGDMRDACANFRTVLRDDPQTESLRIQASTSCEQAGEIDTAEQILSQGFVDPADAMPIAEALVSFLVRNGRVLTAKALVNQWLRDHPDRQEFRQWRERVSTTPGTAVPQSSPPASSRP